MLETVSPPSVFTATSAYSLAGVAGIAVFATTAARTLLPKNAPWQDRVTFIWLVSTPFFQPPHLFFFLGFADDVIRFDYVYLNLYDYKCNNLSNAETK